MGDEIRQAVQSIPAEARWAIATKSLTGGLAAMGGALAQTGNQELYEALERAIWSEGGRQSAQLARSLGLPAGTAEETMRASAVIAMTVMGPDFVIEVTAIGSDHVQAEVKECAWKSRALEMNLPLHICGPGCLAWHEAFTGSLRPDLRTERTRCVGTGDATCVFETRRH